MDDESYQGTKESCSYKIISYIQSIWPFIYRNLNGLFWGILGFIKDTLGGLWRR